jgi:hypothetical protein
MSICIGEKVDNQKEIGQAGSMIRFYEIQFTPAFGLWSEACILTEQFLNTNRCSWFFVQFIFGVEEHSFQDKQKDASRRQNELRENRTR